MFKFTLACALIAIAAAHSGYLHDDFRAPIIKEVVAPSLITKEVEYKTFQVPSTVEVREESLAKVGERVESIPVGKSGYSTSVVHDHAHIITPIIAEGVRTKLIPTVKNYEVKTIQEAPIIKTIEHAPIVKTIEHAPILKSIEHAPLIKSFEHAPLIKSYEHAPLIKSYEHTPLIKSYEHAPLINSFEHAPLINSFEHAPLIKSFEHSPLIKSFEHGPLVKTLNAPFVKTIDGGFIRYGDDGQYKPYDDLLEKVKDRDFMEVDKLRTIDNDLLVKLKDREVMDVDKIRELDDKLTTHPHAFATLRTVPGTVALAGQSW